jgi:hypothetical protein
MDHEDIAQLLAFTDILSQYLVNIFGQKLQEYTLRHTPQQGKDMPSITHVVPPLSLPLHLIADCESIATSLVEAFRNPCQCCIGTHSYVLIFVNARYLTMGCSPIL